MYVNHLVIEKNVLVIVFNHLFITKCVELLDISAQKRLQMFL